MKKGFAGNKTNLDDVANTQKLSNLNDVEAVNALMENNADIILVFGTQPLKSHILDINPNNIFNLHGGDPEKYRGLDSHLWAIYQNEFSGLVTTLHRLSIKLDTGEIVNQAILPIKNSLPLYALREINTERCLKLTLKAIEMKVSSGKIPSSPQRQLGNYYSAMPKELKSICVQKFQNFTKLKK